MRSVKVRRILACAMAVAMMAGTMTGCGGESSSAKEDVPTLTVLCHSSWRTEAAQAAFDVVEESMNVKFEFEEVPEGDAGEQLIFAKYSTDEVPDILWWQKASLVNTNIGADKFEDLSGDWEEEYDENMIHTSYYEADDKLIEAPFGEPTLFGIFYNKTVFEENHIEIPESFDDLREACKTLKDAGVIPYYISGSDAWTVQHGLLDSWGKEKAVNKSFAEQINTNQTTFSDVQASLDYLDLMNEFVKDGYIQETFLSDTYADAQEALLSGEAAMYPLANYIWAQLINLGAGEDELDNIGYFPFPTEDGKNVVASYEPPTGFLVSEAGDQKELAKEAVAALVSSEAVQAYLDVQPSIVSNKKVQSDGYGLIKDAQDLLNEGRVITSPEADFKYQLGTLAIYVQDMLVGNRSSEDVLAEMDALTNKMAKEEGDSNFGH